MSSKDLISKQLLKRLLVDFGTQLFKLNIIDAELLSSEQPRVEGKRAGQLNPQIISAIANHAAVITSASAPRASTAKTPK